MIKHLSGITLLVMIFVVVLTVHFLWLPAVTPFPPIEARIIDLRSIAIRAGRACSGVIDEMPLYLHVQSDCIADDSTIVFVLPAAVKASDVDLQTRDGQFTTQIKRYLVGHRATWAVAR